MIYDWAPILNLYRKNICTVRANKFRKNGKIWNDGKSSVALETQT